MLSRDERWEIMLEDLHILSTYHFTGSVRFSMKNGQVSLETLKTLRRYAQIAANPADEPALQEA